MAKALYPSNSFCIVWYILKGKNAESYMYTYLTTALFFVNNEYNKRKYLTLFSKYKVINCHLNYNKVLYKFIDL